MLPYISVAVDGPCGAGKSTLAKLAAKELHFLYVDTGAIYRTVGLCALRHHIQPADTQSIIALLDSIKLDLNYEADGLQHMYLEGEDVTNMIRLPEVSSYASNVSALPEVRAFLMEMQRELARKNNVIMDGRDIGTVVLPEADVKIYLTASAEERANRRFLELQERGSCTDYQTVLKEMLERDERDTNRETAPLRQAEDAVFVDTSGMTQEQSLELLLSTIKERLRA